MVQPWWSRHGRTMVHLPWFSNGSTMFQPWSYNGWFCNGAPILVNLDNSPEVDEWLSKSGSRINNHLFTDCRFRCCYFLLSPSFCCFGLSSRCDWSLISMTNWFPSVLWRCWLGHLTRKSRPRNDLWCVKWDVKPLLTHHAEQHCECENVRCKTCSQSVSLHSGSVNVIHWNSVCTINKPPTGSDAQLA